MSNKEPDSYVSQEFNISYLISKGLLDLLIKSSNKSKSEVWCAISEMANKCAFRLKNRPGQVDSWSVSKFPGTEVKLKLKVRRAIGRGRGSKLLNCKIVVDEKDMEEFTQEDVNNAIAENILLSDEDE